MSKEYITKRFRATFGDKTWNILRDNKIMIAGGCFTSAFSNAEVNDVDCYFHSREQLIEVLTCLEDEFMNCYINSVTDKSLTVVGVGSKNSPLSLQFIYFDYFEDLNSVFDKFDWTINMCGWQFDPEAEDEGKLIYHEDFFSDLSQKRLSFNTNTAFPLISGFRVNKYKDRGYTISRSEMLKVLIEIAKLDISTKEEFIKHVGGMYGAEILKRVEEMPDEGFTPEAAIELVSETYSQPRSLLETEYEQQEMLRTSCGDLIEIMELENPEYTILGEDAYDQNGDTWDATLMKIFHPSGYQGKINAIENGLYYKWVNKVNGNPTKFTSCYKSDFYYELGEEVTDTDHGLYVLTKDKAYDHYFRRGERELIACSVSNDDFLGFESISGGKFKVSKLTPLFVVPEADQKKPQLKGGSILVGLNKED